MYMNNSSTEPDRRISRLAISGVLLLPFGLLLLLFIIPSSNDPANYSPSQWPAALRYLLLALGSIAPIASTILGYLSIAQIRKSKGSIFGMRLAVFLGLFYPIILLSLILFILGWTLLGNIRSTGLIPLAWLVIVLAIDYWIVRVTWNKAIS